MRTKDIVIPEDLLRLKHSIELESVSMSSLARKGTSVLQRIMATTQAVMVKIQGHGAMVTVSQRQYDEMVDLIHRLQQDTASDDFTQTLGRRFDALVAGMNQPEAVRATEATLFGEPSALNKTYQRGTTETDD
jgi:PHD/YefM family antitoxin component YafN of YafNO toxin-antitoxin module